MQLSDLIDIATYIGWAVFVFALARILLGDPR